MSNMRKIGKICKAVDRYSCEIEKTAEVTWGGVATVGVGVVVVAAMIGMIVVSFGGAIPFIAAGGAAAAAGGAAAAAGGAAAGGGAAAVGTMFAATVVGGVIGGVSTKMAWSQDDIKNLKNTLSEILHLMDLQKQDGPIPAQYQKTFDSFYKHLQNIISNIDQMTKPPTGNALDTSQIKAMMEFLKTCNAYFRELTDIKTMLKGLQDWQSGIGEALEGTGFFSGLTRLGELSRFQAKSSETLQTVMNFVQNSLKEADKKAIEIKEKIKQEHPELGEKIESAMATGQLPSSIQSNQAAQQSNQTAKTVTTGAAGVAAAKIKF